MRAAPSAVRIAISRDRADARASIRFATLKHAISSTIVTEPIIVRMMSGTSDGIARSRSVRMYAPTLVLVSGYAAAKFDAMASASCRACSSVTPSRSRAYTSSQRTALFCCPELRERDPEVGDLWKAEPRRHDPDHGVRNGVHHDRAPDRRRIGVVPAPPQVVADDDDGRGAFAIVRGVERPPELRRLSKKREEIRVDRGA
jgi:hypothetical protein